MGRALQVRGNAVQSTPSHYIWRPWRCAPVRGSPSLRAMDDTIKPDTA